MKILLVSKWVDGGVNGAFHHSGEWADSFELAQAFSKLGHLVAIVTPQVYPKHAKVFEEEFGRGLKKEKIEHIQAPVFLNLGLNEGVFQLKMHWASLKAVKKFKPNIIQFMQLTPTFIQHFTHVPIFFYGVIINFDYPKSKEDASEKIIALNSKRNLAQIFSNFIYFSLVRAFNLKGFSTLTRIGTVIVKHQKGYQKLKREAPVKENVYYVHKGVNLRRAARSPLNGQTVLFIGSVSYRKGLFDLLEAFTKIAPNLPQAKLLIAGSGPKRLVNKARSVIKRNRINAKLLGPVSYSQKWMLFKKADIFCLPSYADASPAVILEAMASSLPIVTTYQADSPIKNGQDAILVNAGDVEAISASLEKLLKNPKYAQKLANSSYKKALLYSWEKQAAKILNLYDKKLKLKIV